MAAGLLRITVLGLVLSLVVAGCDSRPEVRSNPGVEAQGGLGEPKPGPSSPPAEGDRTPDSPVPDPSPEEEALPPDYSPAARLADRPAALADQLTKVHDELAREIENWLANGGLPGPASRSIALKSLFQQRIYRALTQDARLARATLERVAPRHASTARDNYNAGNGLSSGLTPLKPPVRFKTSAPASPHVLLELHTAAGDEYGIPWQILAAVNLVETRFGRILGPSSAGALGPMQFLPSTWERYGGGGDIMDPRDSIFAAARYLAASGGRDDINAALYQYNPSRDYVNAVRLYARSMRKDPKNFYSFYYWQVFVRTTKGDKQLTGPGSDYPR